MSWLGREFETTVGAPGHGGFCVARHEGRVVFVRHSLPDEAVRARVIDDPGGGYCWADAVEIVSASPHRIDSVCPVAGPGGAGCCDFAHVEPSAARELKAAVLAEQLTRIAGWDFQAEATVDVEALPGPVDGKYWRTRVRLAVDDAGVLGYRQFRGSEIVPAAGCPQLVGDGLLGLDEQTWTPGSEVSVTIDDTGARHVAAFDPVAPGSGSARRTVRGRTQSRRAASAHRPKYRVVEGSGRAKQIVDGREWDLTTTSFWQSHAAAATVYSQVVREWSGAQPGDRAWDLYGGAGVFAAVLAEQVGDSGRVDSVDTTPSAGRAGQAALADLPHARFHTGPVERIVNSLETADIAVLDPPRKGAGNAVIGALAAANVPRVVHFGCDPASFATDLTRYRTNGYRVAQMRAFDGFPLTHHLEAVALLVRD